MTTRKAPLRSSMMIPSGYRRCALAVVMKPGDVGAMRANIRHQGYALKRAMLLVWENADPALPELYATGKLPSHPVDF
jgi:hypothetical protein